MVGKQNSPDPQALLEFELFGKEYLTNKPWKSDIRKNLAKNESKIMVFNLPMIYERGDCC